MNITHVLFCNFSFSLCLLMAAPIWSQEIKIETPKDWRGETIKLPPGFAPDMKLKGVEEIRFAPGMFKPDEKDFFSYIFVFEVDESQKLDAKVIERELLVYYRGLCKSVLGDSAKVDTSKFTLKMKQQKSDKAENAKFETTQFHVTLEWVEPFVSKKPQTLYLEIDSWHVAKRKKNLLFVSASPSQRKTEIWKTMRGIRDSFVPSTLK